MIGTVLVSLFLVLVIVWADCVNDDSRS